MVGYTQLSERLGAAATAAMLERLFLMFDAAAARHGIFTIDTVGDCYIAASGVPDFQTDHALRAARFGLEVARAAQQCAVDPAAEAMGCVAVRVGLSSGSAVGTLVGTRHPKWTLLGDTVNVAARMESSSEASRVALSDAAEEALRRQAPHVRVLPRGNLQARPNTFLRNLLVWFLACGARLSQKDVPIPLQIKGKGTLPCFFLDSSDAAFHIAFRRPSAVRRALAIVGRALPAAVVHGTRGMLASGSGKRTGSAALRASIDVGRVQPDGAHHFPHAVPKRASRSIDDGDKRGSAPWVPPPAPQPGGGRLGRILSARVEEVQAENEEAGPLRVSAWVDQVSMECAAAELEHNRQA